MRIYYCKKILKISLEKAFEIASKIEKFGEFVPEYESQLVSETPFCKIVKVSNRNIKISHPMVLASSVNAKEHKITNYQISGSTVDINIAEWAFTPEDVNRTLVTAKITCNSLEKGFRKIYWEWKVLPIWIRVSFEKIFSAIELRAYQL